MATATTLLHDLGRGEPQHRLALECPKTGECAGRIGLQCLQGLSLELVSRSTVLACLEQDVAVQANLYAGFAAVANVLGELNRECRGHRQGPGSVIAQVS